MNVSIRQIAKYCDVSIGTVDRVLNDRPGVKHQTKEKVQQAIQTLGYTPNHIAKSLAVGKSMSIGVILFNLSNTFFAEMSDAIVNRSHDLGYFPYLTLSEKNPEKEFDCIKDLIARQVDGLILFSTNYDPAIIDYISSGKIPIVTIMTRLSNLPSVGINDHAASCDATNYIANRKYKHIVYISPPLSYKKHMNISVQEDRLAGFISAAEKLKINYSIIDNGSYLEQIDNMDINSEKTAFLCSSDMYALKILRHMRLKGLQAPFDFGLMGFDNINVLKYIEPAISTVSIPIADAGMCAVDVLISGIVNGSVQSVVLPHKLIPGQTIL